jgi:hypothetical protein
MKSLKRIAAKITSIIFFHPTKKPKYFIKLNSKFLEKHPEFLEFIRKAYEKELREIRKKNQEMERLEKEIKKKKLEKR